MQIGLARTADLEKEKKMSAEWITKDDLEVFRSDLLNDIRQILTASRVKQEEEPWLKSKEVREILKVSPNTLQNLRIAGKLTPVKVSGSWRYSQSEVQALFLRNKC